MENSRQLKVTLFDKEFNRLGWVNDYVSVTVTERFLAQSTGELIVKATDPKLGMMLTPGARVLVEYFIGDSGFVAAKQGNDTGHRMISGPLRQKSGSYLSTGTVTFQIEGDWRVLRNFRAWPVPTGNLTAASLTDAAQSTNVGAAPPSGEDSGRNGYYNWPSSGPVDGVGAVRLLVDANINTRWNARFGENLVNVPGTGGGDIFALLPQVRFGSVEQYVVPILIASNLAMSISIRDLGFTVPATPDRWGLEARFWTPKTWPIVFTPESGTVLDGTWSITDPQVTDVVMGGPGDLSARAFAGYTDLDTSILYRDIIEVFREATGAPVQWPTTLDEKFRIVKYYLLRPEITAAQKAAFTKFLDDGAADVFSDGAPTSGVSLTLAESEGFKFSATDSGLDGFRVGDIINTAPSIAAARELLTFAERIMAVTVTQNAQNGVTVSPQVGMRKDDPDVQLALAVQQLALANARRSTSQ